jgi:hypothetical protein
MVMRHRARHIGLKHALEYRRVCLAQPTLFFYPLQKFISIDSDYHLQFEFQLF